MSTPSAELIGAIPASGGAELRLEWLVWPNDDRPVLSLRRFEAGRPTKSGIVLARHRLDELLGLLQEAKVRVEEREAAGIVPVLDELRGEL